MSMHLKMESEETAQQLVILDETNSSVQSFSHNTDVCRTRRTLLLLLTIMFIFSLLYLSFVCLSCVSTTDSWLCQQFSRNYEFIWALVSLVYDGLWLLVTYRYCSKALLLFVWFSTIFLFIFGIFLVMALLTIFQTMMYLHLVPTHILIASISSIVVCFATSILQVVIILFSYKLSKLITKSEHSTT